MAFRDTVESPEMQTCIAHCSRCHEVCLKSAAHCLKERGDEWQLVTTLLVCAEVCRLSADTMIRGSELHRRHRLPGPVLIEEQTTTVLVGPRDIIEVDEADNFVIEVGARA